ncbi:hypothetical protein [Mesorhizobium sp.]|uniref:hypothetical protein n=1 Tax=Mesorhizobium sp. TaxID=1871066 RepID=UPI00257C9B37|nr:hypothetical protein [Mesorhizobium sp.]
MPKIAIVISSPMIGSAFGDALGDLITWTVGRDGNRLQLAGLAYYHLKISFESRNIRDGRRQHQTFRDLPFEPARFIRTSG